MSQERRDSGAPPPRPGFGFGRGPLGRGMPVQKAKDFRGTLRRLVVRLAPHRAQLALVVSAALLGTLFGIVSPKLLGEVTTKLFVGLMALQRGEPGAAIDQAGIGRILLILAGLYLFSNAFGYLQQYVMAGVAQKLVRQLRNDVSAKMARLPLRYFDARPHGEILSRVVNDLDNISTTLQQSLIQVITSVVTFVGVVVMMLTISPLMTLVVFLTLPLSLFVTAKIAKRSQKFFTAQRAALGRLNGHVEEMYTGHAIIKAFGREPTALAQFEAHNAALYEAGWKSQFVSSIIWPLMQLVGNIGYVFVCVAGGILVLQRTIQVGDIQAFIQYARQFSQPLTQIAGIANIIQSTIASAERVFEILDEPEETPDAETPALVSAPRGEVRFAGVRFGYEPEKPLYEDLAIHVQRGQTVAVVGPTGAGKTTLVNLLLRFYEIDGGEITIDGLDIRSLRRGELRRLFGMVLQDTWLFNGTLRENIAYGRPGATEEEIVAAARAAHADHFIRTLPDGYDTVINEEASNISQGQKQLLTIARALLADPAVLILDEATSNVDTRTEAAIQQAMSTLMQGRTNFVIAHRLSTIRDADVILVMDRGRVIEQGNHGELLARGGFYAELYQSQFTDGTTQPAV